MNRSRSDAVPEWFAQVMAPLIRRCKPDRGEFTEDDARDYFAILKGVPPKYLAAAVVEHLRTAKEPWMPMPAAILQLAREARRKHVAQVIRDAPECLVCENTGLVSARERGSANRFSAFACTSCARGMGYRSHRKFDPESMETWREVGRAITSNNATIAIPDFSVPQPELKSNDQQREELAQWQARKEAHRQELEAGARELAEHSEKKGGRT